MNLERLESAQNWGRREGEDVEEWSVLDHRAHVWQSWDKNWLTIPSCSKPFRSAVVSDNGHVHIFATEVKHN